MTIREDDGMKVKELFIKFWVGLEMLCACARGDALNLYFKIKSWQGKAKRFAWNRGIELFWNRLWVRKDEFHSSTDMDFEAMLDMRKKQQEEYIRDLCERRRIAHERDLAK